MKLWKKGLALLLAISLLAVTACGQKEPVPDDKTAMGRYIEEQWELPMDAVNVFILARRPDGKIFAVMNDMGPNGDGENVSFKGYVTSDGKDWQEDTPAWLTELLEKGGYVRDFTYAENDDCLFIYGGMDGENYVQRVARVTADGVFSDIDGEWEKMLRDKDTLTYNVVVPSSSEQPGEEAPEEGEPGSEDNRVEPENTATEAPEAAAAQGVVVTDAVNESESEEAESIVQVSSFYPTGIAAGVNGDFYISDYSGVARFDASGRFIMKVGDCSYPYFTYYDSTVAILNYGSVGGSADTFKLYDIEAGGERQDLGLENLQSTQQNARIATGEDGALYLANPNGIYRLVPDGTTWERMADGNLCSLSVPSMQTDKFIPHSNGEFLTLTTGQDKPVLINYVYSADTPTMPNTELTIAALKKNNTLLQAAGEFRRLHPEVLVTVQTLLEEDGSATVADAVRALNTQLLAGKGPDLLLLDGLPIESYIDKGVLADMSGWLNPVIEEELVPNVAGAYNKNNKLYAVPARFHMPTVWGRPEPVGAASSMEAVIKYAETYGDRKLLYAMDKESLFRFFYNTSAPAWLDSKGRLDEAAFEEYLEMVKRLADTVPSSTQVEDEVRTTPGFTMDGIDTGGAVEVAFGKAELFSAELFGFNSVMVPNGAISVLNGVIVSAETTSVADSLISGHVALLPGQSSGVFIPSCVVGINAAGKQQELAQEFIRTLLGETVQYSDLQDGFPVNRAAIEKNILRKDDIYMSFTNTDEETGETLFMEMGWPSSGVFRAVCALFDKLDTPYMPDDTLMEMILSETEGFFGGSLTARETASAVAARLELRLAEQS